MTAAELVTATFDRLHVSDLTVCDLYHEDV